MSHCDQCHCMLIQGVLCHEIGCPESWRDTVRDCHECGFEFIPEESDQYHCQSCIDDHSQRCEQQWEEFPDQYDQMGMADDLYDF